MHTSPVAPGAPAVHFVASSQEPLTAVAHEVVQVGVARTATVPSVRIGAPRWIAAEAGRANASTTAAATSSAPKSACRRYEREVGAGMAASFVFIGVPGPPAAAHRACRGRAAARWGQAPEERSGPRRRWDGRHRRER